MSIRVPGNGRALILSLFLIGFLQVSGGSATPQAYSFSPHAANLLDRLARLRALPGPTWRYHIGNLPHGESPDLNDGDWPIVTKDFAETDVVWLRAEITVPKSLYGYDLTGARVWFHMNAYANGPVPQIIYFNGSRVAMGTDLEDIVLFNCAHPGDKVLVAVKLLATVDLKQFVNKTDMGIPISPDMRVADLRIDPAPDRPSPEDVRRELISAAELLPALPSGNGELARRENTLESAANAVELPALEAGDQKAFDASLRAAQTQLATLHPAFSDYTIHLIGNNHMDIAWLWPWTETVDNVRRTFATSLQLMEEYPQYRFSESGAQYYEWMQQKDAFLFNGIQERVKDGHWEIVGGMWAEPDLNLPDGESQVRQLLVGKRYFQQNFGVDVRVGWNPDSFGFNWQLPQIYKKSGIDYFVTQKLGWNETNKLPLKLFWWQAPDGSRILTYFPHDYVNQIDPVRIAGDLAHAVSLNPGAFDMMHLYGIGDHGGGPTRDMLDSGIHWQGAGLVFPRMQFDTALSFFQQMASGVDTQNAPVWNYETLAAGETQLAAAPAGKIALPVWNDELYLEYHRGTYTTQAKQKASLRRSSEWLLNAEKFSSLAWLGGREYPSSSLNEAWKLVLKNQWHDLAAGSGAGIIYADAQKEFQVAHWAADQATGDALNEIDSHIDTRAPTGVPLLVWNTLSWTRTDLVTATVQMPEPAPNGLSVLDANGKVLASQLLSADESNHTYRILVRTDDLPSVGYAVLHVVSGTRPFTSDLHAEGTTLENDSLRVVVDPKTGCIVSLYDKHSKFESLAAGGCGNMLEAFVDRPKQWDAWNIDADTLDHFTPLMAADSVQLTEKGPLRADIRITRHWSKSTFVQDIVLYAGMPRVDVVNDIDWHEDHILLKAAFPLAATANMATYEIPYGSIQRPTTRNNSIEAAKFEVPAIRWADLGDSQHGFSLINDSKYGYDTKGNVMRLTLLRSPTWPDPQADRGKQHFAYSLYPHEGTWRDADTVRRGYEFNYQLRAMQVQPHSGTLPPVHSFFSIQPATLVMTAIKKSEDGNDLILRIYDWAGKKADAEVSVPGGATRAVMANLMEAPEGVPLAISGNKISVGVGPYSINTLRVSWGNRGDAFWGDQ
jgi:alpha-mannosidase